jgi:hypothetical protein
MSKKKHKDFNKVKNNEREKKVYCGIIVRFPDSACDRELDNNYECPVHGDGSYENE